MALQTSWQPTAAANHRDSLIAPRIAPCLDAGFGVGVGALYADFLWEVDNMVKPRTKTGSPDTVAQSQIRF